MTDCIGKQRQLADQRAGTNRDFAALGERARLENQRALLHDIAAIGELAGIEQHRTALQSPRFSADSQNTQRLLAERRQRRHPFEKRDVLFNAHDYALTTPPGYGNAVVGRSAVHRPANRDRQVMRGIRAPFVVLTAPVYSHRPRSPR